MQDISLNSASDLNLIISILNHNLTSSLVYSPVEFNFVSHDGVPSDSRTINRQNIFIYWRNFVLSSRVMRAYLLVNFSGHGDALTPNIACNTLRRTIRCDSSILTAVLQTMLAVLLCTHTYRRRPKSFAHFLNGTRCSDAGSSTSTSENGYVCVYCLVCVRMSSNPVNVFSTTESWMLLRCSPIFSIQT